MRFMKGLSLRLCRSAMYVGHMVLMVCFEDGSYFPFCRDACFDFDAACQCIHRPPLFDLGFFLSLFFLSFLCSSFFFSISQYVLYSPFVSFPEPCSIPAIIFPFFPAWHQDRRHHKQTKWIGYISSWDAVVFGRLELTRFTILLLYQAGATLPCRLYLLFLRGRFCNSFPAFCASGKKEEEKSLIWKENRFGNVAFEQAVLVSISFTCLIIGCRLAIVWLQRVNTPVDYRILPYLMTIWC